MNQYTDEIIVNSADSIGSETGKYLKIFKSALLKVKDGVSYTATYHLPTDGVKDVAVVTPTATAIPVANAGKVYRLWVELGERDDHQAEFQNALTRENKVIAVEATAALNYGKTAIDLKALMDDIKSALDLQKRLGKILNVTWSVDSSTNALTLTAVDEYIVIKKCELQLITVDPMETITGYDHFETAVEAVITKGKAPFGTADWIVRNLRVPTLAHTSWLAVSKEDKPIPGQKYVQFCIRMVADRGELTGMGAVGQKLTSVTDHVFYVLGDSASATAPAKMISALLSGLNVIASEYPVAKTTSASAGE